jgi:hypothetical protein
MRPAATARADKVRAGTNVERTVQRLADALLLLAARRYPEPLRSEVAPEWSGELHAIVHDDGRSRPYCACWALLYSGSLAVTALSSQARQAGTTLFGATKRRIGLLAVVFIAIITAAAIIRAVAAYADANARDVARSDAYTAADDAYAHAAHAAHACRDAIDAIDAARATDACYHSSVIVAHPSVIVAFDVRADSAFDVAASALGAAASTRDTAIRAAYTANRAADASTRARDAAHAAVTVAFAATTVFVVAFAFACVKIRRARRRLRS